MDFSKWAPHSWTNNVQTVPGQTQDIRLSVPDGILVAVFSFIYSNIDSKDHDLELNLEGPSGRPAQVYKTKSMSGPNDEPLIPASQLNDSYPSSLQQPLLLYGPIDLTVIDGDDWNLAVTPLHQIVWMQSRATGADTGIVPTATNIP